MVLALAIGTLLSAISLWVAMKLTRIDGSIIAILIISAVSSLMTHFPVVGNIISAIVTLFLICRLTSAELWPDAVLIMVVARGVAMLGRLMLMNAFLVR